MQDIAEREMIETLSESAGAKHRGRPKGSKNKPKETESLDKLTDTGVIEDTPVKKHRGRPKGSKNKEKEMHELDTIRAASKDNAETYKPALSNDMADAEIKELIKRLVEGLEGSKEIERNRGQLTEAESKRVLKLISDTANRIANVIHNSERPSLELIELYAFIRVRESEFIGRDTPVRESIQCEANSDANKDIEEQSNDSVRITRKKKMHGIVERWHDDGKSAEMKETAAKEFPIQFGGVRYKNVKDWARDYGVSPEAAGCVTSDNATKEKLESIISEDRNRWKARELFIDGKSVGTVGYWSDTLGNSYIELMQQIFRYVKPNPVVTYTIKWKRAVSNR